MGNSPSSVDSRLISASRAFTPREYEGLRSLFDSLANQSHSNGRFITQSVFLEFFGVQGPVGERLYDLVTGQRKDGRLTFEDLVVAKSIYERGTDREIDEFIYHMIDLTGDGIVDSSDLETVLHSVIEIVLSYNQADYAPNYNTNMVNALLNASVFSKNDGKDSSSNMSLEDFKHWCALVPSVRKSLRSLLTPPQLGRPAFQFPLLNQDEVKVDGTLLTAMFAWHIRGALSLINQEEWTLLYHSAAKGLSFTTFMNSLSCFDGPTVLIVKDKEGCIYGGYASQPWERQADFFGDLKSFLFQLHPTVSIFKATGVNNNIQWCAVNFTSETIPNGIGFGGRANHFGLFISANFDRGHSFGCTTFGSPCLSVATHIFPETIECWGIASKDSLFGKQDVRKGSVLERFKEDRHMLNMVGIADSSQAI